MGSSPLLEKKQSFLFGLIVSLTLITPVFLWQQETASLTLYLSGSIPKGQLAYVLAKLFGLQTLCCILVQIIIGLLLRTAIISSKNSQLYHRCFGSLTLAFALLHILLFFIAMTLRQGSIAWSLFIPNLDGYYHRYITVGLVAIILLFVVVWGGILRAMNSASRWAHHIHRCYWLVGGLGIAHALAIGSETNSITAMLFFTLLLSTCLFLVIKLYRTKTNNISQQRPS